MSIVCKRCKQLTGQDLCERCCNDLNEEQAQEQAHEEALYEERLWQLRWEEYETEQERER